MLIVIMIWRLDTRRAWAK